MKCPIRRWTFDVEAQQLIPEQLDCLKEKCAWWDEVKGCCGERTKRLQIKRIADTLKDIRDKMPHEEQFRR